MEVYPLVNVYEKRTGKIPTIAGICWDLLGKSTTFRLGHGFGMSLFVCKNQAGSPLGVHI